MDVRRIEHTPCETCSGTGKQPDGTLCATCKGTGVVAVLIEAAKPAATPRQYTKERRFPRYRTDLPLQVRDHHERDVQGRCRVIAEGGLGALLGEPIAVGSIVQLTLALPTHPTPVEAWAIVRYQLDLQHGFEFVSMGDDERLSLKQFCNELAVGLPPQQPTPLEK